MSKKYSNSLKSDELLKDDHTPQYALQTSQQMRAATLDAIRNVFPFVDVRKPLSAPAVTTTEYSVGVFSNQTG